MKMQRIHNIVSLWIFTILSSSGVAEEPAYVADALSYFEINEIESDDPGVIRERLAEVFSRYESTSELLISVEKWNDERHIIPVVFQSEELGVVNFEFYYPSNKDTRTVRVTAKFGESGLEFVGYGVGATTKQFWQIIEDLRRSTEVMPWGYREKTH